MRTPAAPRSGLTLLEVLTALAIFLFSFVALGRLIGLSGDLAVEAAARGQAAQLAQSKLEEVIAGLVPLQSQPDAPLDEDPNWQWSLSAETDPNITGLWRVQVTVKQAHATGQPVEATLNQIIIDPTLRGSALDVTSSSSSSSTTTTTGSGTGGN
jgi:prepilin-type N-terminal cleavage/methylation domain-containing protein